MKASSTTRVTTTEHLDGAVEVIFTNPTTHVVRVDGRKTYCGIGVRVVGDETMLIKRITCKRCLASLRKRGSVRTDTITTTSTIWKAQLINRRFDGGAREVSGPALVEVRVVDDGVHTPSYYVFADGEQLFGGFASHLDGQGLPPIGRGAVRFIEPLDVEPEPSLIELFAMADAGDTGAREYLADINAERPRCEWFAMCDRLAAAYVEHPIMGAVPACSGCIAKLDLDII